MKKKEEQAKFSLYIVVLWARQTLKQIKTSCDWIRNETRGSIKFLLFYDYSTNHVVSRLKWPIKWIIRNFLSNRESCGVDLIIKFSQYACINISLSVYVLCEQSRKEVIIQQLSTKWNILIRFLQSKQTYFFDWLHQKLLWCTYPSLGHFIDQNKHVTTLCSTLLGTL